LVTIAYFRHRSQPPPSTFYGEGRKGGTKAYEGRKEGYGRTDGRNMDGLMERRKESYRRKGHGRKEGRI
jgi:hypothetical protein